MVGRGTRLFPGKTHLLLLDFLWHTEKHELCRPAHLIAENEEVAKAMVERTEENTGAEFELLELEEVAKEDVTAQREEALAKQLLKCERENASLWIHYNSRCRFMQKTSRAMFHHLDGR